MISRKKRKLDVSGSSSPQLSAVAAARARRQQQSHSSISGDYDSPTKDLPTDGSRSGSADVRRGNRSSQSHSTEHAKVPPRTSSPDPDPSFKAAVYQSAAEYHSESESGRESSSIQFLESPGLHSDYALCSWRPTSANVLSDTKTRLRIRLDPGETVALVGQYDLRVEAGVVMLYGVILHAGPKSFRVFAPSTHALPLIESFRHAAMPTIIELCSCKTGMQSLARLSPLFRRIWNYNTLAATEPALDVEPESRSFSVVGKTSDDGFKRQLVPLQVPWKWHQAISALATPSDNRLPRVMVCGPKATGKSTLARLMINRLLGVSPSVTAYANPVHLLDLDPGQSEYSPPGQISLVQILQPNFGPPFSHPGTNIKGRVRTVRAHALGSTSPKEDPDHFLRCALNLMAEFDIILPRSPLVINTPGWAIGTGGDILVQLIKNLDLSEILYTKDDDKPQVIQTLTQAAGKTPLRLLPSQQSSAVSSRSAAELRDMQTLSYFHQAPVRNANLRWGPSPLTNQKPYVVGYGENNSTILGVMCYGDWPGAEYLSTLLDGCLVSICILEDIDGDIDYDLGGAFHQPPELTVSRATESRIPYIAPSPAGFVAPLAPRTSYCVGQALIRGIDLNTQTFHILTPVPASTLSALDPTKTVLVKGTEAAPGWAYMEAAAWRNSNNRIESRIESSARMLKQPWVQEIGPEGRGAGAAPLRTRRFRGVERG